MPPSKEVLLAKIHNAFFHAPFPADGYDIYAAQTDDDYGSPCFTTDQLPGRKWFEVTNEQLDDCYAAASYLRPDGWRHYLPAWLNREIKEPHGGKAEILFSLRIPSDESAVARQEVRHALLDGAQTAAVVAFLDYYRFREKASHAREAKNMYADGGMEWTEAVFPWPDEDSFGKLLEYWIGRLTALG